MLFWTSFFYLTANAFKKFEERFAHWLSGGLLLVLMLNSIYLTVCELQVHKQTVHLQQRRRKGPVTSSTLPFSLACPLTIMMRQATITPGNKNVRLRDVKSRLTFTFMSAYPLPALYRIFSFDLYNSNIRVSRY